MIVIDGPRGQERRRTRSNGPPQLGQELAAGADGGQGVPLEDVMARRPSGRAAQPREGNSGRHREPAARSCSRRGGTPRESKRAWPTHDRSIGSVAVSLGLGREIAQGAVDRCSGPELDPVDGMARTVDESRIPRLQRGPGLAGLLIAVMAVADQVNQRDALGKGCEHFLGSR